MGAFNPRHRLRSRVNPVRQMSQGEPRASRRLQPTVRAGIRRAVVMLVVVVVISSCTTDWDKRLSGGEGGVI